ncbi:MAG: hypothetical protein H0V72_29355, partial [Bradyrhizobium sp.]|nr:hypothetical protein [Bradyrhizobium sp.]
MTNPLPSGLTAEPVETSAVNHGAEQAVADALGLTCSMPPQLPLALPPPLPKPPAQNFIARHWRGELSLPRSYWINYFLLGAAVGIAFAALSVVINQSAVEQPVWWLISLGLTWSAII